MNSLSPGAGKPVPVMRESGIELLRCLAMLMVLGLHINFKSLSIPTTADLQAAPLNAATRVFLESLCIGAVNIFVFISGWFGIHPKLKGLAKLLFQTFFFTLGSYFVLLVAGVEPASPTAIIKGVWHGLLLGSEGWFVKSYIALFILAPLCNAFLARASRRQVEIILVAYLVFEFVYGCVIRAASDFMAGYSTLSFIALYMLARYVHLYHGGRIASMRRGWLLGGFCLMVVLTFVLTLPFPVRGIGEINGSATMYCSPLVIGMACFLVPYFSRLRFKSRWVNKLAASAFSIYLLHTAASVWPHFLTLNQWVYARWSGVTYLAVAFGLALAIYFATFLLDQVRILCWNGLWRLVGPRVPRWIDEELKELPR